MSLRLVTGPNYTNERDVDDDPDDVDRVHLGARWLRSALNAGANLADATADALNLDDETRAALHDIERLLDDALPEQGLH